MDWLNSLGAATCTVSVLKLLIHKLDIDQTVNLSNLALSLLVET